jgi:hypothetical protein
MKCGVQSTPEQNARCGLSAARKRIRLGVPKGYHPAFWTRNPCFKSVLCVAMAIKDGILSVQPCEVCGISGNGPYGRRLIEAHQPDYNRPLDVNRLCQKHHAEWHAKNVAVEPDEELWSLNALQFYERGIQQQSVKAKDTGIENYTGLRLS